MSLVRAYLGLVKAVVLAVAGLVDSGCWDALAEEPPPDEREGP